jgi:hypothetical protein
VLINLLLASGCTQRCSLCVPDPRQDDLVAVRQVGEELLGRGLRRR